LWQVFRGPAGLAVHLVKYNALLYLCLRISGLHLVIYFLYYLEYIAMKFTFVSLRIVAALAYLGHILAAVMSFPAFSTCQNTLRCTLRSEYKTYSSAVPKSILCSLTNPCTLTHGLMQMNSMRIILQTNKQSRLQLKQLPAAWYLKPPKNQRCFRFSSTSCAQEGTGNMQNTSVNHADFEKFVMESAAASGVSLKFIPAVVSRSSGSDFEHDSAHSCENALSGVSEAKVPMFTTSERTGTIKSLVFVCNGDPILVIIR
jgi:hypothetical protein